MNKKTIIYICYVDLQLSQYGSIVRPREMYNAFLEQGFNVLLLSGKQFQIKNRTKSIIKFFRNYKDLIKKENIEFCYIESPVESIMNPFDYFLIYYIHSKKIPILYFYRDCYWKFKLHRFKNPLKEIICQVFGRLDLRFFNKNIDKIYFPSNLMANFFNFKSKDNLYPAGKIQITKFKNFNFSAIYVGSLSKRYGIEILLKTFESLNENFNNITLNLVCRKEDFFNMQYLLKDYLKHAWLHIYHVSGDGLAEIYIKSDIAIIPIQKNFYNDFAVPIKLFEYMSYALPIVSTNCNETSDIIKNYDIGLVCEDNCESLSAGIIKIFSDTSLYNHYKENVIKALLNENLWKHRVEKVIKDAEKIRQA